MHFFRSGNSLLKSMICPYNLRVLDQNFSLYHCILSKTIDFQDFSVAWILYEARGSWLQTSEKWIFGVYLKIVQKSELVSANSFISGTLKFHAVSIFFDMSRPSIGLQLSQRMCTILYNVNFIIRYILETAMLYHSQGLFCSQIGIQYTHDHKVNVKT